MNEITDNTIGAWLTMLIEEHMESMRSGNAGPQPDIVYNDDTETATVEQIEGSGRLIKLAIKTSNGETVAFRIQIDEEI